MQDTRDTPYDTVCYLYPDTQFVDPVADLDISRSYFCQKVDLGDGRVSYRAYDYMLNRYFECKSREAAERLARNLERQLAYETEYMRRCEEQGVPVLDAAEDTDLWWTYFARVVLPMRPYEA